MSLDKLFEELHELAKPRPLYLSDTIESFNEGEVEREIRVTVFFDQRRNKSHGTFAVSAPVDHLPFDIREEIISKTKAVVASDIDEADEQAALAEAELPPVVLGRLPEEVRDRLG